MVFDAPVATVASVAFSEEPQYEHSLAVNSLSFAYPGFKPTLSNFTLQLPSGSRCLLIGPNGAGKTTLLQLLAGKHMVGKDVIRVLGRPAFHDLQLTSSGELSYLGSQWRRDVSCAAYGVPMQGDIRAGSMIFGVEGVDPARRQKLIDLLEIDLNWRLNKVSDGQRRRVQIAMGLLKPYKVLLLDEITVDMDVIGRLDLLAFFKEECDEMGATIVYATHIFDGLERWATHLAYVEDGTLAKGGPMASFPELSNCRLLRVVESWLRSARDAQRQAARDNPDKEDNPAAETSARAVSNPFASAYGRHMAFYR